MFKKILIANRGEIACRIIKTAKRLGIQTVAVYSEIDANTLHVKMADEAYLIGPAPSRDSYLNINAILKVAKKSGAEAIHPGYGFLSENAEFAEKCRKAHITFIGPSANAIKAMGSKIHAKEIMVKAQVPVTPGYYGKSQTLTTFQKEAKKIGYPVMLKAAAGGGGKGMRLVNHPNELAAALAGAKREAKASFDDEQMLLEKYLPNCRHIEVQIFGDSFGNYVYLFERDCSIQRRHQKIIEEAPAPKISNELRKKIGEIAVTAARAIKYVNAGTIEFLLDEKQQFYFMEMNTRLQVEHPITEMITQQDLVEWQLRIAAGKKLPVTQQQLKLKGHAIEARIYAEDPTNNFLPSTGKIIHLQQPQQNEHVRIDSGVVQGDEINIYYDPLIAKLICWDTERSTVVARLAQALNEYQIVGVKTNIDLLKKIIRHPEFTRENINTQFLDHHPAIFSNIESSPSSIIFAIATLYILLSQKNFLTTLPEENSPWLLPDNWRLNFTESQIISFNFQNLKVAVSIAREADYYQLKINDQIIHAQGILNEQDQLQATIDEKPVTATVIQHQQSLHIFFDKAHYQLQLQDIADDKSLTAESNNQLRSPMPGTIATILVKPGQKVMKGDPLLIIEAMKMEHAIIAPANAMVEQLYFQRGDLVGEGQELLKLIFSS